MKEKNKKKNYNICSIDITNAVSTNECTGLMPTAPNSEEEIESYFQIMNFSPKLVENEGK